MSHPDVLPVHRFQCCGLFVEVPPELRAEVEAAGPTYPCPLCDVAVEA